jgi:ketosteroid isomerase-like protein
MADHPNAELFRRGYQAFQSGDLDTVRSLFAPDIVWHVPGNNQLSGDYKGADATINSFIRNFELSDGTFKVELHDILANDEHAVALATASGQREGKTLDDRYVHVVHIKDGTLTESWIFDEKQGEVDAFWG